jgi:A/G-specific adenine glycosylase
VKELECKIPENSQALRQLPGVGRYTAAAIASITFNEPVAVVDGNVERVLSRLDGMERAGEAVWQRAQELLDPRHSGDWNQAIMELGATVCTPRAPQCLVCPVHAWCQAPGAETARPQPARKRLNATRALVQHSGRVYLVCRAADAAKMAGMWELPEVSANPDKGVELGTVRHSITDTDYAVRTISMPLKALEAKVRRSGRWVSVPELAGLPLTGLTRKILRQQHIL